MFSTRFINDVATIFSNASIKENDEFKLSLCDYFVDRNKNELKNYIPDDAQNSISEQGRPQDDIFKDLWEVVEGSALDKKTKDTIEIAYNKSDEDPKGFILEISNNTANINDETSNKVNSLIEEYHRNAGSGQPKDFTLDDFKKYQNNDAVNINVSGKTLKERVSLYHVGLKEDDDYGIYAVWPLDEKSPDNDFFDDKNKRKESKWVNSLVKSVESIMSNGAELFLLLHRRDLKSTQDSQFCVEYIKEKFPLDQKEVYVSLCVFQHPDTEFKKLTNMSEGISAKSVFEKVKEVVEKTSIRQILLELSDNLSMWPNKKEEYKENIEKLKTLIKNWDTSDWSGLRWGSRLLENWSDKTERKCEKLLFINTQINNRIKSYI